MTGSPGIDLYWLPLGTGGRPVRLNGKVLEAVAARIARRPACDLYRPALVVRTAGDEVVVEQALDRGGDGTERGVVARGPVGVRLAGRSGSSATRRVAGRAASSRTSTRRWTARGA